MARHARAATGVVGSRLGLCWSMDLGKDRESALWCEGIGLSRFSRAAPAAMRGAGQAVDCGLGNLVRRVLGGGPPVREKPFDGLGGRIRTAPHDEQVGQSLCPPAGNGSLRGDDSKYLGNPGSELSLGENHLVVLV